MKYSTVFSAVLPMLAAAALLAASTSSSLSEQPRQLQLKTAPAASAVCNPACPSGQVCKWKSASGGGGETVCSADIIDPTKIPLPGRTPQGPTSVQQQ